jgi:hypothetical protein
VEKIEIFRIPKMEVHYVYSGFKGLIDLELLEF